MAEFIRIPNDKKVCLELLKSQAKKHPDDHHYQAAISSMEATLSVPLDQKLSPVVVDRISSLKRLLNHPGVRPDEILNVKAIIEAYETGSLSAESRKSVWIHGKRRQECETDDLNIHALPAGLSYENSGLIWVEDSRPLLQKAAVLNIASGPDGHHYYFLLVRLPGTELTIEVSVLDDTGSSVIDLFEFPDTILLRPAVNRLTWVCLDTNNGRVWKRSLSVEVNMRDNHGAFIFKEWRTMQASITQGNSEESVRCSGGFVREVLFTGTAAKADSKLVLSTTKTGMTANIPAR